MNAALPQLFPAPVYLYRWNFGWMLGHRFLLLIHIGRRTGPCRYTVLEVMEYRKEGSRRGRNGAFGRNADWLRNIQATPSPVVVIGSRRRLLGWCYDGSESARRRLVKQPPVLKFRSASQSAR